MRYITDNTGVVPGRGQPTAGREENAGPGCRAGTHSFTGVTPVLKADGTSKPVSEVKTGDKVADSVPGQAGTQAHTVHLSWATFS